MPRDDLAVLARLAHQEWREDAACRDAWRSRMEFVEPPPSDVDDLIRTYCWACPVVGACRTFGDETAPHKHAVIFGARYYAAGEPVDGYSFEEAAS